MLNLKVAVASCCSVRLRPNADQPAWQQIRDANPDLLLLLGDNVYMHHSIVGETEWDHYTLELRYREQFEIPEFAALLAETPHMAIWDDHDFGVNDAKGGDPFQCPPEDVRKTTDRFRRWMHRAINLQGAPAVPGTICGAATIGGIRFIALDGRTMRTQPNLQPEATVLGQPQRDWLRGELIEHRHTPVVVASGSCLSLGAIGERLLDYAEFRDTLLPAMKAHGRVLFLGGDIHFNAYVARNGLHEVITSGVAQRVGDPPFDTNNWALLTFSADALQVEWRGSRAKEFSADNPQGKPLERRHRQLKIDVNTWSASTP